jgi:hypothetical protein
VVICVRLKLMDSLQFVEPCLATREVELCGFLHKTELRIYVLELLRITQSMPIISVD